jgi:DNA primase
LQELYGLFQAKKQIAKEKLVYMVEGYTDVLSMHQCGIENVVANSGTALNDAQIHLLKRFTENIILIYDGDEAGIHAAIRGTDMLLAQNMNVKVLILPDGHDPDSFSRQHSAQEFKDYVRDHQTDFIIFKVNLLMKDAGNDPRKRSEVTENILNSISVIPNEIVRSAYIHECAELMNMDEQMLLRRCLQLRKSNHEKKEKEKEQEMARKQRLEQLGQQQQETGQQQEGGQQQTINPHADIVHNTSGQGGTVSTDVPQEGNTLDKTAQQTSATTQNPESGMTGIHSPQVQQYQPVSDKWENDIVGLETLIMQMVVRYGEQWITTEDENGQQTEIQVVRWVQEQLDVDQMKFVSPLYTAMMDDALTHLGRQGETCRRIFLSSPDMQIQHVASEMLNEKYRVDSTFYSGEEVENVAVIIQRLMLDYKYYFIRREIHMMKLQLADKTVAADSVRYMEILKRYKFFTDIQKQLAKNLGEKIISV